MMTWADHYWRVLVNYYGQSRICVRHNGQRSALFSVNGGVKQGGTLSPYLFNFYIDELIRQCIDLNVGCKIGEYNASILASILLA